MEAAIRNKKLSLKEELLSNPAQFSFEMAAKILEFGSETSFGKEINFLGAPFKTRNIYSFYLRGTEIEKISMEDEVPVIYTERLSISGLNAPLPTPYAELIFMRTREKDTAMSDFINAFNARLLGISYQISKRRYLSIQQHNKINCPLLKTIATFLGESSATMDRRMSRFLYLFWIKEKSAAGLETLIFSFLHFKTRVKQIQTFWADRREIYRLGDLKLGNNSELGTKFSLSSFGIEINLTHKNYDKIFQLINNKKYLHDLKFLIQKYIGDFFYYTLSVTPESVPPLKMGESYLGKTSWMQGSVLDSIKMIC
ncbi:MAG: type VI secretion system baseplate subunit TssG [Holosporaceae bacterium]|jgi:predicted component of type VI protein secretion system|nr:type VI secretion system baseplate subunit TssG [Holosporaceae bacterium]